MLLKSNERSECCTLKHRSINQFYANSKSSIFDIFTHNYSKNKNDVDHSQ